MGRVEIFDALRRLTNYALDAEDRFSILVSGTDTVVRTLKDPALESFCARLGLVQALKPFNLQDTRNCVAHQLRYARARSELVAAGAVRNIFQTSGGIPRRIILVGLHTLVQAAVVGIDAISADFMQLQLNAHPLYDTVGNA